MNNPWDKVGTPSRNILSRRVKADHPLNLFWARDPYGNFLFVYEFLNSEHLPDKLPILNGVTIYLHSPKKNHTKRYLLILKLNDKKDWQIFLSLCNDIINTTSGFEKSTKATKVILRRLRRWQEFLQLPRSELMSEKSIKGLIGELLFITKHLKPAFGIAQAIQYWQGPDDLPQDFNVENCAIEVKCQLGNTSPKVRISSADQLCTQLPEMYLHVVTLGKTDADDTSAINLPLLTAQIRHQLETTPSSYERFNNLLYQTGYIDSDEYLKFSYVFVSELIFSVEDGFPRICSEDLIQGVGRVAYDINLYDCELFTGSPEWMKSL